VERKSVKNGHIFLS